MLPVVIRRQFDLIWLSAQQLCACLAASGRAQLPGSPGFLSGPARPHAPPKKPCSADARLRRQETPGRVAALSMMLTQVGRRPTQSTARAAEGHAAALPAPPPSTRHPPPPPRSAPSITAASCPMGLRPSRPPPPQPAPWRCCWRRRRRRCRLLLRRCLSCQRCCCCWSWRRRLPPRPRRARRCWCWQGRPRHRHPASHRTPVQSSSGCTPAGRRGGAGLGGGGSGRGRPRTMCRSQRQRGPAVPTPCLRCSPTPPTTPPPPVTHLGGVVLGLVQREAAGQQRGLVQQLRQVGGAVGVLLVQQGLWVGGWVGGGGGGGNGRDQVACQETEGSSSKVGGARGEGPQGHV